VTSLNQHLLTDTKFPASHQSHPDFTQCTFYPVKPDQETLYPTGDDPDVLTEIYQPGVRLTCWQRTPGTKAMRYVNWLTERGHLLPLRLVATPEALTEHLQNDLPNHPDRASFIADIVYLTEMFTCLFDMEEVGLRLSLLTQAMCPRFHVDRIGARMVCTYSGQGTEWLPNEAIDRTKLGRGSQGLTDDQSGLYPLEITPNQVDTGDVVIMKGDAWPDHEGQGLVHRSPACSPDEPRLFVSMDVM